MVCHYPHFQARYMKLTRAYCKSPGARTFLSAATSPFPNAHRTHVAADRNVRAPVLLLQQALTSPAVNPVRGGIFVEGNTNPRPSFLFFSGAVNKTTTRENTGPQRAIVAGKPPRPRRRKTKKNDVGGLVPTNMSPLTGLDPSALRLPTRHSSPGTRHSS